RTLRNGPAIGGGQWRTVINDDANDRQAAPETGDTAPPEQAHEKATGTALLFRLGRFGFAPARRLGIILRGLATATRATASFGTIDGKGHGLAHCRLHALSLGCRARLRLVLLGSGGPNAVVGRNAEI